MIRRHPGTLAGLLMLAALAGPVNAQGSRGTELGIDLELTFATRDPGVTVLSIPNGSVRAGFPVSPEISIEPRLSLQYAHSSGSSVTVLDAQLGVLWHFSTDPARSTGYVRPFFAHSHVGGSFAGGDASSLGGGIGFKFPQGDRLALRVEGGFRHSLDDLASGQIFLLLGISFFTR
jgi:hypothetical protein